MPRRYCFFSIIAAFNLGCEAELQTESVGRSRSGRRSRRQNTEACSASTASQ